MRLAIDDIPSRGRTIRFDLGSTEEREAVGLALDGSVRGMSGELFIERVKGDVIVLAKGTVTVSRACDRCGVDIDVTLDADERMVYRPPQTDAPSGEVELEPEELDVGFLEDDAVQTADVIAEAFALALPMRVTCGVDACPNARLLEDSGDDDVAGHPAFAALKDLL